MTGADVSTLLTDAWETTAQSRSPASASERDRLTGRVKSRRRRAWAGRAAVATAASGVLVAGGLGVANAMGSNGRHVAPATPQPTDAEPAPIADTTLLLVRTDVSVEDPHAPPGNAEGSGPRLDGVAIVHIAEGGTRVEVVSLYPGVAADAPPCTLWDGSTLSDDAPRLDGYVARAFETGTFADGIACTEATVSAATGLKFDGVIATSFSGFIKSADALGGAVMCIPEAIDAERSHLSLKAGNQRLAGQDLLALARARNGTGLGGGHESPRAEREARVLVALGLSARDNVANGGPKALVDILNDAYVTGVVADPAWLDRAASSLREVATEAFIPLTVPLVIGEGGDATWGEEATRVFDSIASDQPVASTSIGAAECTP